MKGKVLIVDDDPIMGTILKTSLNQAGFQTVYFNTGAEALSKALDINPDLIISDIVMPQIDGYELHRRFRKNPKTANIPFVFLSVLKEVDDQLEGLRMGADDYICKPFEINDLLIRMEKVMIRAAKARSFRSLADFSGNLAHMNLNDIIQIVEMNYKTGELRILDSGRNLIGAIYFKEGLLINAKKSALDGEYAFFDLMESKEGYFEFYDKAMSEPEKISESNMSMLLKGSRLLDESRVFFEGITADEIIPVIKSMTAVQAAGDKLETGHLESVLTHLDGAKTIQELIDSEKVSRVVLGTVLGHLNQAGLLEFKRKKTITPAAPPSRIVLKDSLFRAITDIAQRQETGIIAIKGSALTGKILFRQGRLINAQYGNTTGKKALFRLFREKSPHLLFYPQPINDEPLISQETAQLIKEGIREAQAYSKLDPNSFDKKLIIHPSVDDDIYPAKLNVDQDNFLPLVKQYGNIRDVIEASPMTDLQTYELIFYLLQTNVLEIKDDSRIEIQLVIDSGADLPAELIEKYDMMLVPLTVSFGTKKYYDGINLKPDKFYQLLAEQTPIINPPKADELNFIFKDIAEDKDILAIFMSDQLSEAYRNAKEAQDKHYYSYLEQRHRRNYKGDDFQMTILDSRSVSLGAGLIALEAAEKKAQGWQFTKILSYIEDLSNQVYVLIIPPASDDQHKTAWLSKLKQQLPESPKSFRNTRPILMFHQGTITIPDQLLPGENESHKLAACIRATLNNPDMPIKAAVIHGNRPEWTQEMTALIKKSFSCDQIISAPIGPAMGANLGTGAVAVAYFAIEQLRQ